LLFYLTQENSNIADNTTPVIDYNGKVQALLALILSALWKCKKLFSRLGESADRCKRNLIHNA